MSENSSARRPLSPETRTGHENLQKLAEIAHRQGLDPMAERLFELRTWLSDELMELELALGDMAARSPADVAWAAANHLVGQPGKRVRPICVLLAAKMGGRSFDDAVKAVAMACELVHSATLLHDDVLDLGTERRGGPTSRLLYGNAASVLGGDHLLINALIRVDRIGLGLQTSLLEVVADMVSAEVLQLELRRTFRPDRDLYLRVVEGKTAALFRWALEAGGTLGGLNGREVHLLGEVGRALGMTFQLVDDLLDLEGDPEVTGKNAFADMQEGKLTWPLIIAAERSPQVALNLRALAGGEGHGSIQDGSTQDDSTQVEKNQDPGALELLAQIRATGALDATRAAAAAYVDEARGFIHRLPKGASREALETVVETALNRCR